MSGFNKFGSIKDGKINARFYLRGDEVDYANCYRIFNLEPIGDKFDLPMQASISSGSYVVIQGGQVLGELPRSWKALLAEIARRGPIDGTGAVSWLKDEQHFRVRFDIDEG